MNQEKYVFKYFLEHYKSESGEWYTSSSDEKFYISSEDVFYHNVMDNIKNSQGVQWINVNLEHIQRFDNILHQHIIAFPSELIPMLDTTIRQGL